MFKEGQYVIYGSKGVCEIQSVSYINVPGADQKRLYYIMRPVYNGNGTVYLPVDSTKVVIRAVMTEAESGQLLSEISSIPALVVANEKSREATYKEALRTCDSRDWVSLMKLLYERRASRLSVGKKITALDERYLKAAEQAFYGELTLVLQKTKEELSENIKIL